jgi:putative ABC transport system substrate-binding protein
MRRRGALFAVFGVTLLSGTHRVNAQTDKRRVAYLSIGSATDPGSMFPRFMDWLRELGWTEGSNLIVDARFTQGDRARWAPLTGELLALQPDVLVASTDFMLVPGAAATKTVPLVFVGGIDPVGLGLVKSLARPGANVTGLSALEIELIPKRLALLKEAVPGLKVVGVFTSSNRWGLDTFEDVRRKLDLQFVPALTDRPEDLEPAFEKFAKAGATGALDLSSVVFGERYRVAALAIKHRIAMLSSPAIADSGVLLSYGHNHSELFKRAATLVDRILKGAKPADIPVEQVNVYEFVVNLRTARALGIELPQTLILQATRVIE